MKQWDVYDGMAAIGLMLLAGGLWMFSPAIALTAVGGILLILGVFLASRRG